MVKVLQIQRKDDSDSISGKITDFTSETISNCSWLLKVVTAIVLTINISG